jgi:hypothetical protein
VPDNSAVELSDPVTVQTVPDSSQTVEKVEYYLNGKLIKTVKEAPFTYTVDTRNMKNGTYQLTTKTYYEDGTFDSKTTSLVVKNPMSFKQIMLQLGALVWIIILILIAAAVGVWYVFFRNRSGGGDGYDDSDSYMFGPNDPMMGPPAGPGPTYGPPAAPGQNGQYSVLQPVAETVAIGNDLSRY